MRSILLTGFASLLIVPAALAQSFTTGPCEANHDWSPRPHVCERRSATIPLKGGRIAVDGKNGGIEVIGEDRSDVALEAQVSAQAFSRDGAESILREVRVVTTDVIHAEGPQSEHGNSWSVNYKLRVPRHVAAQLETMNGGISLSNLDGDLHAQTTNGGLSLANLSGDVHATTVNGGVHVELAGDTWHGAGLEARSTNGGVHVTLPSNYSAHLIAGTVNGGTHVNLPMTSNNWHSRNHIDADLGHGGPTLRMETTNGGITVN